MLLFLLTINLDYLILILDNNSDNEENIKNKILVYYFSHLTFNDPIEIANEVYKLNHQYQLSQYLIATTNSSVVQTIRETLDGFIVLQIADCADLYQEAVTRISKGEIVASASARRSLEIAINDMKSLEHTAFLNAYRATKQTIRTYGEKRRLPHPFIRRYRNC